MAEPIPPEPTPPPVDSDLPPEPTPPKEIPIDTLREGSRTVSDGVIRSRAENFYAPLAASGLEGKELAAASATMTSSASESTRTLIGVNTFLTAPAEGFKSKPGGEPAADLTRGADGSRANPVILRIPDKSGSGTRMVRVDAIMGATDSTDTAEGEFTCRIEELDDKGRPTGVKSPDQKINRRLVADGFMVANRAAVLEAVPPGQRAFMEAHIKALEQSYEAGGKYKIESNDPYKLVTEAAYAVGVHTAADWEAAIAADRIAADQVDALKGILEGQLVIDGPTFGRIIDLVSGDAEVLTSNLAGITSTKEKFSRWLADCAVGQPHPDGKGHVVTAEDRHVWSTGQQEAEVMEDLYKKVLEAKRAGTDVFAEGLRKQQDGKVAGAIGFCTAVRTGDASEAVKLMVGDENDMRLTLAEQEKIKAQKAAMNKYLKIGGIAGAAVLGGLILTMANSSKREQ